MAINEAILQNVLTLESVLEAPVTLPVIELDLPVSHSQIESAVDELMPAVTTDAVAAADSTRVEPEIAAALVEPLWPATPEEGIELDAAIAALESALNNGSVSLFETDPLAELTASSMGNWGASLNAGSSSLYNYPIEYGTPLTDISYWRQQQGGFSCAVVAQISAYHSLTGQYISESAASNYAQQQGWFDPLTGTPVQHMGNLLDVLGVPTYEMYYASLGTLQQALARGDKPIVALDANEIWFPQRDWFGNPVEQEIAGHAVWVTGIDYEPNGSIGIIINDSGHANGMANVVDYFDFMNAWQDYNYFVSIADNPYT